ncbi:hypothetical protein RFI_17075 [Reticulomyxa filosa]|uniref:Kelch motif family protein n=1 Tax=Reticulomyxa filosa TaxID=46433 RepID=X6N4A3_RETFI|nr:hypothetical protein RFI_17075 [Reticulomyxa filosa]|eukprot:ETO20142.1 hypothetical protein RFI_17075 [Reticulomyxa filosa]
MSNQTFQILKDLPTPLFQTQCVLHKHELLICGYTNNRRCFSYHILKNEYKPICEYPSDVCLDGHCVVKLIDNNNSNKSSNEITLLSFGGSEHTKRHTLMMKYVSVWSNNNEMDKSKKLKKSNNCNQWMPLNNEEYPIHFGRYVDDYIGVRAVIGGSDKNLLFITFSKNINVFDLNTFKLIKQDYLPIGYPIRCHCFVLKSENGQEMIKMNEEENNIKKKKNHEMLLFCEKTGLSIEYDEDNNTFQFHQLPVHNDIASLNFYAYVCINDVILFFGGLNISNSIASKSVHKYSIQENKWTIFQNALPCPLFDCVAILSEDNTYMHIIGGMNETNQCMSMHMKTKVSEWSSEEEMKQENKLKIEEEKEEKKEEDKNNKIVKKKYNKQDKMNKQITVEFFTFSVVTMFF